jgi:hypothetical protein
MVTQHARTSNLSGHLTWPFNADTSALIAGGCIRMTQMQGYIPFGPPYSKLLAPTALCCADLGLIASSPPSFVVACSNGTVLRGSLFGQPHAPHVRSHAVALVTLLWDCFMKSMYHRFHPRAPFVGPHESAMSDATCRCTLRSNNH